MAASATAVTVVPAAIGLPLPSVTRIPIVAELGAAGAAGLCGMLTAVAAVKVVGDEVDMKTCATEVDMISRWDTPMASVVAVHVVPEQVIPLNVPLGPSYWGAL